MQKESTLHLVLRLRGGLQSLTIITEHSKHKVDTFDDVYSGIQKGRNFILNKKYPGSGKIIYLKMHYLPHCPYSRRALSTLLEFPHSLNVHFFNGSSPRNRAKIQNFLSEYAKENDVSLNVNSMPQLFSHGHPLGGSDTLQERLEKLVE